VTAFSHELRPGDTYEPLRFRISPDLNEQYLFALAEYDRVYLGGAGRRALVHPVLLLHMSARTRSPSFRLAPNMGSVFARDHVTFLRAAYVEQWLEARWTIREVYERKGRVYQGLDTVVLDECSRVVLVRDAHSAFFVRAEPTSGASA
jgi:hypothetical protein